MSRTRDKTEPGEKGTGEQPPATDPHGQPALMQNVLEIVDKALEGMDEVGSPPEEKPR